MTTLRMDANLLRGLAAAIRASYIGPHQEALSRLTRVQGALRSAWSAQAQSALDAAFGNWLAGFDRRGQDLIRIAQYLQRAAEMIEAQDARLAQVLPLGSAAPSGGGGKVHLRPTGQGNGPTISGPVSSANGCLDVRDIPGLAAVNRALPAVPTLISYRADYGLQTYPDRVEVRLTQYSSTNRTIGAAHWWTTATVATASGRTVTYNLGAINLDPARPDSAFLSIPINPSDPPVSMDISVGNAADNAAGAVPIISHYATVPIQAPRPSPTPTLTGPYAPTPAPSGLPGLGGPKPIQVPTPTPQPGVAAPGPTPPSAPTPPKPSVPRGPVVMPE